MAQITSHQVSHQQVQDPVWQIGSAVYKDGTIISVTSQIPSRTPYTQFSEEVNLSLLRKHYTPQFAEPDSPRSWRKKGQSSVSPNELFATLQQPRTAHICIPLWYIYCMRILWATGSCKPLWVSHNIMTLLVVTDVSYINCAHKCPTWIFSFYYRFPKYATKTFVI